jgi:hypothetical protein
MGGKAPPVFMEDLIEGLEPITRLEDPLRQYKRLAEMFAWSVVLQPLLKVFDF